MPFDLRLLIIPLVSLSLSYYQCMILSSSQIYYISYLRIVWLGFWYLTPFSTIFQFVAVRFIGGGYRGYSRKITDLPQVTDKLYLMMLYRVHLDMNEMNRTDNFSGDRR